ncbi:S66 peptidase family protein [Neolewinella persica]|uniref:S66 peptidase family protein n=1 Tax=Neolewinella persica TaxID=70998 RepID=UPI00036CF467|nr:LD-carboxypeptidase [Neolewinella persica]
MQRRTFLGTSLALPFFTSMAGEDKRLIIPARLRPGDTVGLIAPGSSISEEGISKAIRQIESLGLKVRPGKNIRAIKGFLAGSDRQRLDDLHAMFADPAVKAVWCVRGGYGCGRLLPQLDYKMIKRNPKILIGYSDITALTNAITRQTGLVTFHGPVGSSDFTDYTTKHLKAALMEGNSWAAIERPPVSPEETVYESYVIRAGTAEGRLWGGNLSLLAAASGTDYVPPIKGSLLFIEDIGEDPYKLDRMLTQLRQSWDLGSTAGILLGVFKGCEADPDDRSLTLRETLTGRFEDLGIPVAYGFPVGHIKDMCTLPVGLKARVSMERMRVEIIE